MHPRTPVLPTETSTPPATATQGTQGKRPIIKQMKCSKSGDRICAKDGSSPFYKKSLFWCVPHDTLYSMALLGVPAPVAPSGSSVVTRGAVQSTPITDEPLSTHSRVNTPLPATWRWARARMQRIHDVRAQAGREASRHGEVR